MTTMPQKGPQKGLQKGLQKVPQPEPGAGEQNGERLYAVRVRVNGVWHESQVPARRLLSDFLRHDLRLTGTHVGCEHGVCGACTVLVDGRPMRSCLMLAVGARDHEVTTVEGLGTPEDMHPVQQAFRECHGLQCGFCTPGFLTTVAAFVEENPDPTQDEAREAISGNLCRCTGYQNIVRSVLRAAEITRERSSGGFGRPRGPESLPNPPLEQGGADEGGPNPPLEQGGASEGGST